MTETSEPLGEETADVLAVDAAVTALAQRRSTSEDPALLLLAEFARQVDLRADAIGGGSTHAERPAVPALSRPARSRPRRRRRTGLRVLLSALVAAVVGLLVGMLPVNASPSSPLHPLHDLIFQPNPTPAEQVRTDLVLAAQALDHAGDCGSTAQTGTIDQAREHLADARTLLSEVDDQTVRAGLRSELSTLERRADDLAQCDEDEQGGPGGAGDPGQDQQSSAGDQTATPTNDNDGQQGGADPVPAGHAPSH
jgi:hypothetical protein